MQQCHRLTICFDISDLTNSLTIRFNYEKSMLLYTTRRNICGLVANISVRKTNFGTCQYWLLKTYQSGKMFFGLDNFGDHISALRGVKKAFTGSIAYCSICSAHNKFADKIRIVWSIEFVNVVQPFKEHHSFYWKRESKTEDKIYAHIYLFLDSSVHFRFVRDLSVQILVPPQ